MKALIEDIYTEKECQYIKTLFNDDGTVRDIIKKVIGDKIIQSSDRVLLSNPLDIIYLVCLTSKFAASDDECHRVAITVYQYIRATKESVLPFLTDGLDLRFASKTLISLSFFAKALDHRWRYKGAPSPRFYRQVSKSIYKQNGQEDIATHHEQWEGFLGEIFI
jgi:hypothetical protein